MSVNSIVTRVHYWQVEDSLEQGPDYYRFKCMIRYIFSKDKKVTACIWDYNTLGIRKPIITHHHLVSFPSPSVLLTM